MAVRSDELEKNAFFRALQTKYRAKFEYAQKRCWNICVPCQRSLCGVDISHSFIDYHILKPSPFFRGQYVSTGSQAQNHSFEILEKQIKTFSGAVDILMEEISYNEDFKPCKILVIDRPLNRSSSSKSDVEDNKDESHSIRSDLKVICQPSNYLKLLKSFPKSIALLDKRIEQFSSSYVFLPDYLHDAALKLHDLLKWSEKVFTESQEFNILCSNYEMLDLSSSLEFYILSQVHAKLFPVIRRKFYDEDKDINQKLFSLYEDGLTPDQLGVSEPFCCHTPNAVVELASLNLKCSPAEKLMSLMATLEFLNQDITKALYEKVLPLNSNKDIPYITSDDLIPLLVNVIVKARPLYLASNLYYIQNFSWYLSTKDKLSFSLVTFQAAKEFLKSIDVNMLKPSTKSIRKEISLDELMVMTVNMQKSTYEKKTLSDEAPEEKPKPMQSIIDYQLENITKMIEASTWELTRLSGHEDENLDAAHTRAKSNSPKKDENLGDFLNSLQQTSLGFSYGKKT